MLTPIQPSRAGTVAGVQGSISYQYFGQGERPLIVPVNALNQRMASWHRYLPRMLERGDVLLWDYPVYEDTPREAYTVEGFADDLAALLEALGLGGRPLHLLAVCFGSGPAIEFMRRHRAVVRRAVFSGTILTWEESYANQRNVERSLYRDGNLDAIADLFFAYCFSSGFQRMVVSVPPHRSAFVRRIRATVGEPSRLLLESQLDFLQRVEQYHGDYASTDVPIKLLMGQEDMTTPVYVQRKVLALVPGVAYDEYPGAGHLLYVEIEQRFFDDALSFLLA